MSFYEVWEAANRICDEAALAPRLRAPLPWRSALVSAEQEAADRRLIELAAQLFLRRTAAAS
jgi:hypothetical protein